MIKKLIAILLAVMMLCGLAGCAGNKTEGAQTTTAAKPTDAPALSPAPATAAPLSETVQFGSYEWIVLDRQDGKALIITKNIIEAKAYNEKRVDVTWETCTLRQYLNGEFYERFSDADKDRILETTVKNDGEQAFGRDGGNDTTDKIFLLSLNEVLRYFGDDGKLAERVAERGINRVSGSGAGWGVLGEYNLARMASGKDSRRSYYEWWLRSPGLGASWAMYIHDDGEISLEGTWVETYTEFGVRPAMWITL